MKNRNIESRFTSFFRGMDVIKNELWIKPLLLLFAACNIVQDARAQTTVVNVPAGTTGSTLWTDTGITLTAGDKVRINANGVWSAGVSFDNVPGWPVRTPVPADFWNANFVIADGSEFGHSSGLFFANDTIASLVAFVGSDPEQGQWPSSFFPQTDGYWGIGSSSRFTSPTSGKLWLGFNDDADGGPPEDNGGSQMVQIFLNNATNNLTTNFAPVLCEGAFTGNTFSFSATNGAPFSLWAVYDSCDQTNWVFIGLLTLDSAGSNRFSNVAPVPERYYKLDNGMCHSSPYGFGMINVQFPASTGQAIKTGPAAFGPALAYWNVADVLDGEEAPIGDPGSITYEQVFCSDTSHVPTGVTVSLSTLGDPPMGVTSGAGSGSYNAATDPLMLGFDTCGSGNSMTVTISGLNPRGKYDIYFYGLWQNSTARANTQFQLVTGSPDATTSSPNPQSTDSGTSWDINTWQAGKQYVLFHVSFTSPNSGNTRTIRFNVGTFGEFSILNGMQIIRTN
jgi:hypothetical protein